MNDRVRNEITGGVVIGPAIMGRDITLRLPARVPAALLGLPPWSAAFTGRDAELAEVLETLAPHREDGGSAAVVVTAAAVGGLAGIGKTELAVQAARAALSRGWFPGGVLFVDMFGYDDDRRRDPAPVLDGLLRALGVPGEHVPPDGADRARLYASVLAEFAARGRRVLVVVDNAGTEDQARPLLPAAGGCAAIVTSRHTLGLLGARLLDLDVLGPAAAVDMLDRTLRVARPRDTRVADRPHDAAEIARMCGHLPLALRIVAALLAEDPARPLSAIAADLRGPHPLEELRYAETAVRTAFELSYRRLDGEQARVFRLLPLNPGPEVSTRAAAILAGVDDAAARRTLEGLARAHLVERGTGYGRWRTHDLVRRFADDHGRLRAAADGREAAQSRLYDHYLTRTGAAVARLAPQNQVVDGFPDQRKALEWLDAEYPNLRATVLTAGSGHPEVALNLVLALPHFLDRRRRFNDWITLAGLARAAARHLGDSRGEGRALNGLGLALRQTRRFHEAIAAHQDAARLFQEIGDRYGEASALNNLSLVLRELRRFDEAVAVLRQDLEICRDLHDHYAEGLVLNNLGLALREARRPEEAVTVCRDAVRIFQDLGDAHGESSALNNLGMALREVGRFDEAVAVLGQDLEICRSSEDRHGEAQSLNALGLVSRELGRLEAAVTAHRDGAQIFRELDDRHGEAQSLNALALALRELGRYEEAVTAHLDAAGIFRDLDDRHGADVALGDLARTREARRSAGALISNVGGHEDERDGAPGAGA
ncbi:tetratricopeptide repeat protein [Actinomadura alba]|uniref:Tetratricopeptide repeat protein n=1 Tax=Actinomadura alba TaxID=406431 RepID=A0ABR7LLX1_9ACTN|nr:tetratricopeptide repeat protein [Actinomadura alba]MBC6465832.1 tetratricopeptide repeat protein [Actinomadura alba]